MQKIEIPLKKRKVKAVLYIAVSVFILFVFIISAKTIITEFEWYYAIIGVILVIGLCITLTDLYKYFVYNKVCFVAESDGWLLRFYCLSDKHKHFMVSNDIKLEDVSRIYIVRKCKRFLYRNFHFEIEGKSKVSAFIKEEVVLYPSLFEASEADLQAVLRFVGSLNPNIETGYENITEKMEK